jgi:hypothetical protein
MSNYNFKDNLTIDNNRFLKWFNASNTRQDVICLDTSDNLTINDGGGYISLNPSGASHTYINSGNTGLALVDNKLGVGYNTTANTNSALTMVRDSFISTNTVLASNDGYLGFTGSSELSHSAGSSMISYGEDHITLPGHLEYYTGTSGEHSFYTGIDTKRVQILANGTTNFLPNGSTIRLSIKDATSTFDNKVFISDTTQSDNASTGALTVVGGLGVLGNIYVDGTFITNNLQFNSTEPSQSYSSGSISVEGGFGIQSTVDVASVTSGGGLSVAGGFALGKSAIIGGNVTIVSTTLSSNSQTGSLVVYGGVGLNKTINQKAVAPHYNMSPLVTGNESSIHFYSNNDFTETSGTGGGWHIGQNALNVGSGNFTIGHNSNPRLTLNADGTNIIETTSSEALLIRKNGDGGDIFIVDTLNSSVKFLDTEFYNAKDTGNPYINFDAGDRLLYDRTSNQFKFRIGSVNYLEIGNNSMLSQLDLIIDRPSVSALVVRKDLVGDVVFNVDTANSFVNIPRPTVIGVQVNPNTSTGGALNVGGDLVLGATTPRIYFPANSTGQPSFTNRSAGTKIVLFPNTTATSTDYAIGVNSNTLWNSVPTNNELFRWYGGVNEIMSLSGFGVLNIGSHAFVNSTEKVVDTVNPTTRAGGALNVGGDLVLGTTRPRIYFPTNGAGPPTFTNRSDGTKIVLYPNISAGVVDYAIGINTSTLWNSVPSSTEFFKWYGGTTEVMSLSGGGKLTVGGTQATAKSDILNVYNPGGGSGGIILSTVQDIYPTMHHVNFGHDSMAILFDAYYGSDWKSSLSGSNFGIFKNSGQLTFNYTSGFAPGANSNVHTKPAIAINASGLVSFPVTTESTSSGTGAIVVSGGVGIAKRLNVGGNVFAFDAIILDSFNTGRLRLVSTGGANYIQTGLDSINNSYAPLYFTSINGARTFMSIFDTSVRINHTTESTSSSNGALVVSGGVGIAKNLNVSGAGLIATIPTSNSVGVLTVKNFTPRNGTTTGVSSVLRLSTEGTSGLKWDSTLEVHIGTYEANVLARSRADFKMINNDGVITDTTVMTMNANGRIGIGITNPQYTLDVVGDIHTNSQLVVDKTSTSALLVRTDGGASNVLVVDTSGNNGKVNANVIQSKNGFVSTGTSPTVFTSLPYNYNGFLSLNWDNGTALYYYSRVGLVSNGVMRLIFNNVASVIVTAEFTDTGSSINLTVRTDAGTRTVYWSIVNVGAV